ncbi:solute carrier family 25 (mitochondrial carnitine/acylcarnitine transporter), member 20/29 [Fistulifera solaris]|uniref:Solute carrier family 25 (Mitochondrial carnitine/acylcarnitine transporter), member 20/29 n=1 Tax=Fistulifera solaris TaxID=1519565 RepID=A0A1Z5JPN8_FISSO|nr:solute carrier family 25 (mitochondrial carnitine/acylcarnitine transporter), member 20/29 [Fistulifera solaris]|eukprot:GAX15990.1 solute carrier family 25 (mitochondrial carnitine/acylcarnitine transporter), member 20/29 [Fistulifera solaris]
MQCQLLFICLLFLQSHAWVPNVRPPPRKQNVRVSALPTGVASLVAGSVAGAIGVGVSYPLDTLKVKAQLMIPMEDNNLGTDGAAVYSRRAPTTYDVVVHVLKNEGVAGFFSGVKTTMMGQAIIKSVAFGVNAMALEALPGGSTTSLIAAACFAGFVTSFLVAPIERIKVMMQAQGRDLYRNNEILCIKAVLKTDGLKGLMVRGLGLTLAREVPSYGIYFAVYGLLKEFSPFEFALAPLLYGAFSGCASWVPVYPIDVVKSIVQANEGDRTVNVWETTEDLYKREGINGFWNGITPKMLRAAVNHSVTFFTYDLIINALL